MTSLQACAPVDQGAVAIDEAGGHTSRGQRQLPAVFVQPQPCCLPRIVHCG